MMGRRQEGQGQFFYSFDLDADIALPQLGPAIYIRSTHWERDGPG